MKTEEQITALVNLLGKSEERIDNTNHMIGSLVEVVKANQEMYNIHLKSLKESRDKAQSQIDELIKANIELTNLVERLRADTKQIIQGYRDELQSAKAMYNRASEAYIRLAEKPAPSTSSAEVKIASENKQKV